MQLADRVSVNLEAPTQERLDSLAPKKDFSGELLQMLRLAADIRKQHPHEKLAGTVTQFVVGAVGDTDLELLSLSSQLYRNLGLRRVYYSPYHPIEQTPLENFAPTPTIREHRLYQASFLLRDYNWEVEELPFIGAGNLRTDVDPKRAWAEEHLLEQPVELMTAGREQLMRIPGIGPKGADAILKARQIGRLTEIAHLRKLTIHAAEQAAPFILLNGRAPARQLRLF
jgi:predicted DNA-binding helix-hairpin-helix protein